MRGRLVLNGATKIRGSRGEISATHVTLATAIWLQTMVPLTAGDTVELQGYFRVADGTSPPITRPSGAARLGESVCLSARPSLVTGRQIRPWR